MWNEPTRHCERSEAIQGRRDAAPGLLRRFAPRNDGHGVARLAVSAVVRCLTRLAFSLALVVAAPAAMAVQPDEIMPDPALEARARALSSELRCLVCQNQSIDDSDASLAKDIRLLIRQRIAKGESNAEVRDFLVSRYGDFILLKPPFKRETLLLWLSAPLTLTLGGVAIALAARRARTPTPALSAEEERRLAEVASGQEVRDSGADPRLGQRR
jgi:cytochrome c-type biogenesis protein CcmH